MSTTNFYVIDKRKICNMAEFASVKDFEFFKFRSNNNCFYMKVDSKHAVRFTKDANNALIMVKAGECVEKVNAVVTIRIVN